MRILIAAQSKNPVIDELSAALRTSPEVSEVVVGSEPFWSAIENEFDVVHVHWPEALFGWRTPSLREIAELKARLFWWNERALVVTTVHNLLPHDRRRRIAFHQVFELVFGHSRGLIHMGRASQAELASMYPETASSTGKVIPHLLYSTYPNNTDRVRARDRLGVSAESNVALCFGALRSVGDTSLLLGGFYGAKIPRKRLLVAGKISTALPRAQRLLIKGLLRGSPRVHGFLDFVANEDVQYYFHSSDFVVIPRLETLNSGNVILSFAFSKVVVGPDVGVAGEILRDTGNPVYRPGDSRSLARAMERARELSGKGKGRENLEYAQREWSQELIASLHVAFYQELMTSSRGSPGRQRPKPFLASQSSMLDPFPA